ncbi:MAG: DUF3306 domain-containing protein [Hyphomicrobiales bacterium]
MAKQENNEGFMSRWSKRKQAVAAGEEVLDVSPQIAEEAASDVLSEISEERAAELEANKLAAEAIDLESLKYDSDFSAYFKDGVPSLLRQKAMRILWRSNPVLANVDGLCDYDDNFADPALILKKFESAYRIGKGYLFEEEDTESEEELEAVAQDAQDDEDEMLNTEAEAYKKEQEALAEAKETNDEMPDIVALDDGELALEEVPIERPRVSLRQRLQFDT